MNPTADLRCWKAAAVAMIALSLALVGAYLQLWFNLRPDLQRGGDFSALYVGATLWAHGHHSDLYNQALQLAAHKRLLPGYRIDLPFVTPPTTAIALAPLTTLNVEAAYRVWSLAQVLLVALAATLVARHAPWPAATPALVRAATVALATTGVGTVVLLLQGQSDGVIALGLAMTYIRLRQSRDAEAGVWLVASTLTTKPHLAVGLVAFMLLRGPLTLITAMVGTAVAVMAIWILAVTPQGVADFLATTTHFYGHDPLQSQLGITGLVVSWLHQTAFAQFLATSLMVIALAACAVMGYRAGAGLTNLETALGIAVIFSLLLSPHLLTHDLSILAPAMVWITARALHNAHAGRTALTLATVWLALSVATTLDAGNREFAPPGRLVPLALLAMTALFVAMGKSESTK